MIEEFQQQILRLEREINRLQDENKRLREIIDPFSIARATMTAKFGDSVADMDIIELYFAKDGKYVFSIYADHLLKAIINNDKPTR